MIFLFFLMCMFIAINFPLGIALVTSPKFWCVVSISICFQIFFHFPVIPPLTRQQFRRVLFNFHTRVNFPVFLPFLISSFIALWSGKAAGVAAVLHLLCGLACGLPWRARCVCRGERVPCSCRWSVLCGSLGPSGPR